MLEEVCSQSSPGFTANFSRAPPRSIRSSMRAPRPARPDSCLPGSSHDDRDAVEYDPCPCDNQSMTKAELHELVDRLPDQAVDGAAILLGEISDGRIDPEQAGFWTREWQMKEREVDDDLAAGRIARYESDAEFLAALDKRAKPLDADA
jgi:hypothetical protein